MATGRSTEPRTVTITKTSGSSAVTAASGTLNTEDSTRAIAGSGIPAGTTITVASDTAGTLSANATASGAGTAVIGDASTTASQTYGFVGWSPESDAESKSYSVAAFIAGTVSPDRIVDTHTPAIQRGRT